MFLLPSVAVGIVLALALGGRPSRVLDVRLRLTGTVVAALAVQVVLFSRLGDDVPEALRRPLHLATYGLLMLFAGANVRVAPLAPALLGLVLNTVAIAANGGVMPASPAAAEAGGIAIAPDANVGTGAERLRFLGDIFVLPDGLPFGNVFSIGDALLAAGMVSFIVLVSLRNASGRTVSARRLLEPFRTRDYRRLAAAHFLSHTGDWVMFAAIVGWVYGTSDSTGQVAGLLLLRVLPPILGGSVAALVTDRLSKQRVLVGTDIGRVAAAALALVGVFSDSRPAVFGAVVCTGALAAVSASAGPALLPKLVPGVQLASANAGLGIAQNAAMALGGAGAALALATAGPAAALGTAFVAFAASTLLLTRLAAGGPAATRRRESGGPSGLRYLLGHRTLLVVVLSFAAATFATGLTNASLPRFFESGLGLGQEGYGLGIAALSAGLALGQLVLGTFDVGQAGARWMGVGLVLMASFFVLLAFTDHAPTAFLVLVLIGVADGITDVLFDTVVQTEGDPAYLGSVFGFAYACSRATMVAAVALAPLANGLLSPGAVVLVAGGVLGAAAAIALAGRRASRTAAVCAPVGSA